MDDHVVMRVTWSFLFLASGTIVGIIMMIDDG